MMQQIAYVARLQWSFSIYLVGCYRRSTHFRRAHHDVTLSGQPIHRPQFGAHLPRCRQSRVSGADLVPLPLLAPVHACRFQSYRPPGQCGDRQESHMSFGRVVGNCIFYRIQSDDHIQFKQKSYYSEIFILGSLYFYFFLSRGVFPSHKVVHYKRTDLNG